MRGKWWEIKSPSKPRPKGGLLISQVKTDLKFANLLYEITKMKWKAIVILLIIIVAIIPFYSLNKYLQKLIQPRQSMSRLGFYMLSALVIIFIYTFLLVFAIKKLFPEA